MGWDLPDWMMQPARQMKMQCESETPHFCNGHPDDK